MLRINREIDAGSIVIRSDEPVTVSILQDNEAVPFVVVYDGAGEKQLAKVSADGVEYGENAS